MPSTGPVTSIISQLDLVSVGVGCLFGVSLRFLHSPPFISCSSFNLVLSDEICLQRFSQGENQYNGQFCFLSHCQGFYVAAILP